MVIIDLIEVLICQTLWQKVSRIHVSVATVLSSTNASAVLLTLLAGLFVWSVSVHPHHMMCRVMVCAHSGVYVVHHWCDDGITHLLCAASSHDNHCHHRHSDQAEVPGTGQFWTSLAAACNLHSITACSFYPHILC